MSKTRAIGAVLGLALFASCDGRRDVPLPDESDLYAYSLAVAERAAARAPRSKALGVFHVGKVHERFGMEDKALEHYKEALELDANLFEAYQSTGFVLSQRKDRMAEAVEAYQQAIRCSPGTPGSLSRLGLVLMHMNRLDEALHAVDEEIRGNTADENTHYYKGQTLVLLGRQEEAAASFAEAVKIAPEMREAHYALSQSLRALGRTGPAEEAEKKFKELKAKEDAALAANSAVTNNREEHLSHASKAWMDAAALFTSESALVRGDRALMAELQREYFAALREAKRLAPKDLEPRRVLIENLQRFGDWAGAARECSEALTIAPREPGFAPPAVQLAMKTVDSVPKDAPPAHEALLFALKLLEQAIGAKPDSSEAHREAARVLLFRMQADPASVPKALFHAQSAVKILPTAGNYDVLALAYFRARQPDMALRTLEEGVSKNPNDPTLKDRLEKFRQQMQDNGR